MTGIGFGGRSDLGLDSKAGQPVWTLDSKADQLWSPDPDSFFHQTQCLSKWNSSNTSEISFSILFKLFKVLVKETYIS